MDRTELVERYRRADLDCAKVDYRLRGAKMYERETLAPTRENRRALEAQLSAARAQVAALEAPEPAFALMKRHFGDFLDAAEVLLANSFSKPAAAIAKLTRRLENLAGVDTREDAEKAEILGAQLDGLDELLDGVRQCAQSAKEADTAALAAECAEVAGNYRHYAENVGRYFPSLSEKEGAALAKRLLSVCEKLDAWKAVHSGEGASVDDEERSVPFSEAYYRGVLAGQLGVELDELLSWHRTEMERTRAEVFEIAGRLPIAAQPRTMQEVSEVLARYAGPCDSPDEMFRRTRGYLERARAAAREYVWFPEEACWLERVPYPIRQSFPWGGYSDGDGRLRPITGTAFLNDGNFRAISDGWLKMQAVHEAYPGHHIQYVRNVTDSLPETVKLGAKHIPLIEGVAHRSERLFEFVFPEDPFYPLFVAFRRHHTAVRIRSDLMLRLEGRPIRECVQLYMDELGFDHGTARGQVRAQEQMEGYFTCYYYGMKRIADLEVKSGMDSKAFTEQLFSCGNVSMENLEGYLKLDAKQRASYLNDFPSLLMDPAEAARWAKMRAEQR